MRMWAANISYCNFMLLTLYARGEGPCCVTLQFFSFIFFKKLWSMPDGLTFKLCELNFLSVIFLNFVDSFIFAV